MWKKCKNTVVRMEKTKATRQAGNLNAVANDKQSNQQAAIIEYWYGNITKSSKVSQISYLLLARRKAIVMPTSNNLFKQNLSILFDKSNE